MGRATSERGGRHHENGDHESQGQAERGRRAGPRAHEPLEARQKTGVRDWHVGCVPRGGGERKLEFPPRGRALPDRGSIDGRAPVEHWSEVLPRYAEIQVGLANQQAKLRDLGYRTSG